MSLKQNDTEAFFNRIPWCSRLLAAPNTRVLPVHSRTPKSTGEDSLFAGTLQSSRTIIAALALHPRPEHSSESVDSLSILLAIGDGLDGWPSVLHGGIIATLIDEAMGTLLIVDADRVHMRAVATGHKLGERAEFEAHTAELVVRYLKPVKTPGVVLVKCRVVSREGRKTRVRASVLQKTGQQEELDGHMVEMAVGEGFFIEPRRSKL